MSVKSLAILETIVSSARPVSPQDIREATGIPSATVTRLLARLVDRGYIDRVGRGQYLVGSRLRTMMSALPAGATPEAEGADANPVVFLPCLMSVADQIYSGLRSVLSENGINCIMHPILGWPARADELARKQIAESPGIVLFSMNQRLANLQEELRWKGTPAVHAGYSGFDICDTVAWHEHWTYRRLAQGLLERGCGTVIYFSPRGLMHSPSFRMRYRGYVDTMEMAGLEPRLVTMDNRKFFDSETTKSLSSAIGDGMPAGLLVSCDEALPPLIAALEALGLPLGEAVLTASVHCRGRLDEFPDLVERLSLVAVEPWEQVGVVAGRRLLGRIRGDASEPNVSLVRPHIENNS